MHCTFFIYFTLSDVPTVQARRRLSLPLSPFLSPLPIVPLDQVVRRGVLFRLLRHPLLPLAAASAVRIAVSGKIFHLSLDSFFRLRAPGAS